MDKKRIIKNVLFIALVPTVVVAGYYGYKALKNYKLKKKEAEESKEEEETKAEEIKEEGHGVVEKEETKVIPINRMLPVKKDQEETDKVKEA